MKVLNLRCSHGHGFEGWFASDDDFQAHLGHGLIDCPLCADKTITRLPSAPRLNLSGAREPAVPVAPPEGRGGVVAGGGQPPAAMPAELQLAWMKAVQHVLHNTEDVGDRFPEEARRIHYGESDQRGIRGQASAEERAALADEGIEVMALPLPAALKGPAH